jgi:hypothetical protein
MGYLGGGMKRRFALRADGTFVDREGVALRIHAVTIEFPHPSTPTALAAAGGEGEPPAETPTAVAGYPSPVEEVWSHYVATMRPRKATMGDQERAVIRDALKVASVEECKDAITGCSLSRWHMGREDATRGRKFNRLTHILKGKRGGRTTREQIDFFLDIAEEAGARARSQSGAQHGDRRRVAGAKRAVLDAWEFPGDEVVVRRGEEAVRWLQNHGWTIDNGADGRPLFHPPAVEA